MYYILTTYFPDHWDKVRNNRTSYLKRYLGISDDLLINNTPTIFLRINKATSTIEKAWLGKVYDIKDYRVSLKYSIHIDREIEIDSDLVRTKIGWYVINEELNLLSRETEIGESKLNIQNLTGNWDRGWALDLHTLHSIKLPDGKFDTTHTLIGGFLNKLKYWKDQSYAQKIIETSTEFFESSEFKNYHNLIDVIIPVPPSDTVRDFQPVYLLADLVSKKINKPLDTNYLVKLKSTSQIKSIDDAAQRREILKDAFAVKDKKYNGKNILLFDDLYRSGSTLEEITKVFKEKGEVNKVFVLTITKTRTKR